MSRDSLRRLRKRATALMLAVTLMLPEVGVASAAGKEEISTLDKMVANAVMNAVYGVKPAVIPGGTGGGPGAPPAWNHLTKPDRSLIPSIYQPDQQVIRISEDGRYIAYKRREFVPEPLQLYPVIIVYDRVTGSSDTIKGPSSAQTDEILHFDMSGDARYVVFSYVSGLIDQTTQVYLFDRVSRSLTPITGKPGSTGWNETDRVSISKDGSYIVFDSDAVGLVPEDTDEYRDVFVYSRKDESLKRISTRPGLTDYDNSEAPSISSDGRYVAFQSSAALVDNDTNGQKDIYVYDILSAGSSFERVSVGRNSEEANDSSTLPSISRDGRVIAFESYADNLVQGDLNGVKDIFVYNRDTGATVRVSQNPGAVPFNRDSLNPAISSDGRYVGFHLDSMSDIHEEAYVADVAAQSAYSVTVPNAPYRLVNPSFSPVIGRGGKLVVYSSEYFDTIGDPPTEVQFPGIFIASQGAAPVWPPGGKLEAVDRTDTSVRLVWPNASDPVGLLGYHVYQDGKVIGYVPFGAGGNTFTASGLMPGAEYVFQIEAVNTEYLESFGGPTYKFGQGGGENPSGELRVAWNIEDMRGGKAFPGSKLNVTAFGQPAKKVTAELEYVAWKDETSQETSKKTLDLTERAAEPGTYDMDWSLEKDVSQLVSLKVTLKDPLKPDYTKEKMASGFPIQVSGLVTLDFVKPDGVSLAGSVLIMSNSQYGEHVSVLSESNSHPISGLQPGVDYTLVLRSQDLRHTWGTEQVRVEAGRSKTIRMDVVQPSTIRFQIVDSTGKEENGVRLELFDGQQNYLDSFTSGEGGWSEWVNNLKAGETVVAKVDIGDRLVEQVPNQMVVLKPGPNESVIRLKAPGEGILQGYVKAPNGEVVQNAQVTSTQTFQGQQVVRRATTDLTGAYKMSLLKGGAQIEAYEGSYQYSTTGVIAAQITEGTATNMDIPVYQPSTGVVNLEVRLKYIEDTDFSEPVNMEQIGFLTRVESKHGYMSGYFSNAYHFGGSPGDQVSVCVTGTVPAYMTACTDVTLDSNANATAKLYLEEKGARIQGRVADPGRGNVSGALYKVLEKGYRSAASTYVGDNHFMPDGTFNINVPEAGTYVMELTRRLDGYPAKYEYATVQFTAADKQILPLGTVSFSGKQLFSSYNGNYYDALNSRITPGGMVTLRAGYKNGGTSDAADAKLIIDIPEGMTPVKDASGRIIVTGNPSAGEPILDGQTLIVPIGALAKKKSGTISFQFKVDPTFDKSSVKSSARIRAAIGGEQIEETIGTIMLDVPLVTLEAPERVYNRLVDISGVAPALSTVKVYDGRELLGSVSASATGFWKLNVELPNLGDPAMHALRTETESGGVKLQSPVSYVSYDTKKPRLLEMAMAQAPNGKWVTLDARNGIANPPYSVLPGNPFHFELEFDNPDKVENVYVYLDGQDGEPVKAVRDGDVFRAVAPTGRGALGEIYVDYDTKPEPVVFDGKSPSMDEVRASLPLSMRDFTVEVVTPFALTNGFYSGTVKLTFPQLENMTMTVKLTLEPNARYAATSEEVAQVERSGVPIYNSSFDLTETDDGFKTLTKGYMPMGVLFPQGLATSWKASSGNREVAILEADPTFVAVTTETFVQFAPNGEEFGTFNSVKSQYDGMKGFAEKVNKITHNVETSGLDCLPELPRTVKQAGKALVSLVGGEVVKFGLGAWTAAMGLTGAGAIAAAGTSAAIGAKIDNYVDEQINEIGTGYNQCLNEEVDAKKRKRYKIGRPRWIYDPSGYVYEAVPDNRLSGVKATVLYQDPVTKEWTVWDAGPYEQVNPHHTDDLGKYGWDVPEGKWKVVWEKAGYEPQSSAELDVPPPHTEVHAGLVSREAPKVQTVTGVTYNGGSYVDIELTKYVKASDSAIPPQAVTVTGKDGKPLDGTIAFVQPKSNPADPDGAKLSKVVRFTPKTVVQSGYGVKVNAGYFQSYANVWMNGGYTGTFTVQPRDEQGPSAVSASIEAEGRIVKLTFDEQLSDAIDLAKFTWNGSDDLIVSAVKAMAPNDGKTVLLTFSEALAAGSTGQLAVLAGAVSDAEGNGSIQKTMNVSRTGSNPGGGVDPTPRGGSWGGTPSEPTLTKTERFTNDNGGSGLRITLQSDAVAKAIQTAADGKTQLLIEVKDPADEYVLLIPANARTELNKKRASVLFKTSGQQLSIPADVIQKETIPLGASLSVSFGTASSVKEKTAFEAAVSQSGGGLKQASKLMNVKFETVAGQETASLAIDAAAPVLMELPVDMASNQAIYRFDEKSQKWTFVWSQRNSGSGKSSIEIVSSGGAYAVMAYTNPFADIAGHWAAEDVSWMGQRLLVNGVAPGSFKPEETVTRAEFSTMLVRALGLKELSGSSQRKFADVNEDAWYYASVGAAAEAGLIEGVTSDRFEPDAFITREQMTLMIWRAYVYLYSVKEKTSKLELLQHFADRESISAWAEEAVAASLERGLIQGMESGFEPLGKATRAQAAVIVKRLLQQSK